MAIITVRDLCRQFGGQIVLHNVALDLHPAQIVGLVGPNGAGKTTLFRILTGELEPDTGTVVRTKGISIGYLEQESQADPERTLHDEVASAFVELLEMEHRLHEISDQMASCKVDEDLRTLMAAYDRQHARFVAAGGERWQARLNEILGGLGFTPEDRQKSLSQLSGGQRARAALAKLLLQQRQLLLLDEPTNHLDIDTVEWLEKFLASHRGGAVIVSHDRYLLDRLCDSILELDRHQVTSFPGNYTNYAESKEIRELTQQREAEQNAELIKKEQAFIAKHLAGQRSKEAKGRRKRLQRRIGSGELPTDKPASAQRTDLSFSNASGQFGTVLRCENLSMAFGEKPLFGDMSFSIQAGQRFAITGPNGTGKTTLLRILMGELTPCAGTVSIEPGLRLGYYAQQCDQLDPDRTILEHIRNVREELTELQARTLLGAYRFTRDDVFKRLGSLSGGEQSRVRLASLILAQPDILVLDEPTNHLDIPSRETLEQALMDFSGTILLVSHDRYLLDRIADRLLVIRPDRHAVYAGNYSYFVQEQQREREAEAALKTSRKKKDKGSGTKAKERPSGNALYDAMSVSELEEIVIQKETDLSAVHERFGEPRVCKDPDLLAELREEAEALERELAEVDAAWQERVDSQ